MSSDSTAQPCIAIIGGGSGGLALLLTLHRRDFPATLYDRGAGFNARSHLAGTLDLGWKSGLRALHESGLQDEFDKTSRPEGDKMRICDGAGKLHLKLSSRGGGGRPLWGPEDVRPEIDCTDVRKLLLDTVSPSLIQWDHTLSSVPALSNGQHELTFANSVTTACKFLVGADGTNSYVRPLVSPATPVYLGVNDAEISLTPEITKLLELAETIENIDEGMMMAMQDSPLLCAQVNGDGRIRTYAWLLEAESWSPPSDPAEGKAA